MIESETWYKELLEAITAIQANSAGAFRSTPLFEDLLSTLLKFTDSEYGFIGEIPLDEDGNPYLRTCAISNIAWNAETQRFYEENLRKGPEFRNLDTLFGMVMTSEAPVIANSPATDPRRGGLPGGHPNLDSFLGFPLHCGGSMVGMLGVANRPGGYDDKLVKALDPLLQTCANAIFTLRADLRQKSVEARLRDEQSRIRVMLDGVFDGIVPIDEKGNIESVNPAAEQMFGYKIDEMLGRSISLFVPESFRTLHDRLLATFVETGRPGVR